MSLEHLQPEDRARLDNAIVDLENKVTQNPTDKMLLDVLLTVLEGYLPEVSGIGKHTDCQRALFGRVPEEEVRNIHATPHAIKDVLRACTDVLDKHGIYRQHDILQAYQGHIHNIDREITNCDARYELFVEQGIISKLCLSCYKVQILPSSFDSLINIYFLMKNIKLPRDNFRKCMVEPREYSKYGYKGVVYCQSEEEATYCSETIEKALRKIGISDVVFDLSRGCTEFGMDFPAYKYSADGRHRWFKRPESWNQPEAEFLAANRQHNVRPDYNSPGVTIRDVIAFHNWYRYAQVIGDKSCSAFDCLAIDGAFDHLDELILAQAQQRFDELAELKQRARAQN